MASPLQLLQGPTKLLVASALSGLAADLALSVGSPAHCYVHRPAYDNEAFQSLYGTAKQKALATPKLKRPVGFAAMSRLFTPSNVAVVLGKHVALSVLVVVNKWLVMALEEEEAAEAEGREPESAQLSVEDLGAACGRGGQNAGVDLAVQVIRAALDAQALERLPAALAKKLIKDLRQSAVRKGRLPWHTRLTRVARTAAYSESTLWAADFLMSCMLEAQQLLLKAGGSRERRLRQLAMRCGLHAVRAVVVLGAVAIGNSVGAASPKFHGMSMWLSSMGASFVANGYMLALVNRWAPVGGGAGPDGSVSGSTAPAAGPRMGRGPLAAVGPVAAQLQQQVPAGGLMLVGQAVRPDATAAMAAAAAAATVGAAAGPPGEQLANGPLELAGVVAAAAVVEEQHQPGGQNAAAPAAQQHEAGVQAGAPPDAAEPPIPAPQQRRVVGGPRLPERPARRHAAVGPDAPGVPNAAALPPGPVAPPPAAPATPQFRTDQRAPTPAGDSEEAEARAVAAAAATSPSGGRPGAGSSAGSELPGGAASPGSGTASPSGSQQAVPVPFCR